MIDLHREPIPTVRQVDRDVLARTIRQHLAEHWASYSHEEIQHDRLAPTPDDKSPQSHRMSGALMMAEAVCRMAGLDAHVLNREAARLARSQRDHRQKP